ncbi:primosomal replication protein [Candidatus Enterovibrio altilux]|uniref:primosomal replication protein n=1 Tax=Candidatus Enterovibrio altilux TaxID=1927128 RepID=UPI001237F698|nr:primosomal replication protein [Candidatus Enterovibrio luxaltus]
MNLSELKKQLYVLGVHAEEIDHQCGQAIQPLFDQQLFGSLFYFLMPCVSEALSVLKTLEREPLDNFLSTERAVYLCEKLMNQISALQREVAILSVKTKKKDSTAKVSMSISQLYHDVAQHQGWEVRLVAMIKDAEEILKHRCSFTELEQAKKYLIALEKRLVRCSAARQKIEAEVAYYEKKN